MSDSQRDEAPRTRERHRLPRDANHDPAGDNIAFNSVDRAAINFELCIKAAARTTYSK
jgi:hypothetical protein